MFDPQLSESAHFTKRTSSRRIAIVGAGVSGLAAAVRLSDLDPDAELTLFEATDRAGGLFESIRIGDYLVERGADSFITNKPAGVALCRRLGLEDELIDTDPQYRRSLILCQGRPVPTPAGFNLLATDRMGPVLRTPLLTWRGKLRLAMERFVPAKSSGAEESLADFVRRRCGREVLERIVQPLVGGIYTSDPELLSLQATLPRFIEMERKFGSLTAGLKQSRNGQSQTTATEASGARYGLFASLRNGMQQLTDALVDHVQAHGRLEFSRTVESLTWQSERWRVKFSDKTEQTFDGIILAVPSHVAAKLVDGAVPEVAWSLREIKSASSAIVVTGHDLSDFTDRMEAFGLVIPHREQRRILATSFLSRKFPDRAPPGKICLRTFVGGAMQPEEYAKGDDELVETVLCELRSIFGMKAEPDFVSLRRYPTAMPQFTLGHLPRIEHLRSRVAQVPRLELAGNYFGGVGIPDSIQSGERAAAQLVASWRNDET